MLYPTLVAMAILSILECCRGRLNICYDIMAGRLDLDN